MWTIPNRMMQTVIHVEMPWRTLASCSVTARSAHRTSDGFGAGEAVSMWPSRKCRRKKELPLLLPAPPPPRTPPLLSSRLSPLAWASSAGAGAIREDFAQHSRGRRSSRHARASRRRENVTKATPAHWWLCLIIAFEM